jgi:hypothetical protein
MSDNVNHPDHYTSHPARCECGRGVECIQITEHMNFCRGNAVKYLWRAGEKGSELEDLRKARWYVDREIARLGGSATVAPEENVAADLPREWPSLDQVPHDVMVRDRQGDHWRQFCSPGRWELLDVATGSGDDWCGTTDDPAGMSAEYGPFTEVSA